VKKTVTVKRAWKLYDNTGWALCPRGYSVSSGGYHGELSGWAGNTDGSNGFWDDVDYNGRLTNWAIDYFNLPDSLGGRRGWVVSTNYLGWLVDPSSPYFNAPGSPENPASVYVRCYEWVWVR
jgi:hypothetical protein